MRHGKETRKKTEGGGEREREKTQTHTHTITHSYTLTHTTRCWFCSKGAKEFVAALRDCGMECRVVPLKPEYKANPLVRALATAGLGARQRH